MASIESRTGNHVRCTTGSNTNTSNTNYNKNDNNRRRLSETSGRLQDAIADAQR